jgi:hypothetical protein
VFGKGLNEMGDGPKARRFQHFREGRLQRLAPVKRLLIGPATSVRQPEEARA